VKKGNVIIGNCISNILARNENDRTAGKYKIDILRRGICTLRRKILKRSGSRAIAASVRRFTDHKRCNNRKKKVDIVQRKTDQLIERKRFLLGSFFKPSNPIVPNNVKAAMYTSRIEIIGSGYRESVG